MRLVILILALFSALPNAVLGQTRETVTEYTLKNGLKLVVKEDHRAPIVVSQVWYKIGSSYEHDGITGISHVLEHMMFKGTRRHPAGEFSRIIAANGGEENAFTAQDYTAYFQQLESSRLEVSFRLEADRMRNLLLPKDEFDKELKVVMEERRLRTDDDPESLTYERFNATAFLSSPNRTPVIGWMDDLRNLRVDDVRAWYKQWYAPNNATVVVVGDVQPDAVYRLAKRYFGPLKPSPEKTIKPRNEFEQTGMRRIVVKAPAELPYLIMGYKAPVLRTAGQEWKAYALEVLANILDGGESARLARNLVRGQQVAAQASAGYSLYARTGQLFLIDGTPAGNHTTGDLEKAIHKEIDRLRSKPVSPEELQRVKAQVIADNVYQRDSVFYQAMRIGTLESVGIGWRKLDEYVDRIRAITADQVQKVAKEYLNDDQLTVAVLEPLPIDHRTSRPPMPHGAGPIR